MKELMTRLEDEGLNLVILKEGEVLYSSREEGLVSLIDAIDNVGLMMLVNSTVVDKVVGKASALLISYFKAKEIYAQLLSKRAIAVLERYRIPYFSEKIVSEILNPIFNC